MHVMPSNVFTRILRSEALVYKSYSFQNSRSPEIMLMLSLYSSYGLNLIFLVLGHGICVIGLKQRKVEFKSRTKLSHNNNDKYCITSMTIRQLLMFKPNADTTATSLIIIIISRGGCSVRLVLNIDEVLLLQS